MSWIVGSVTFLSEDTELAVHVLRCISSSDVGTTVTKNKKTQKKKAHCAQVQKNQGIVHMRKSMQHIQ